MTLIQSQPEVQALWEKLEGLQLNDNHAVFDFSARLARENGWSHDFTRRVLQEYKRYLLLTRHAGHPVTPSEEVDQAWHLHLVYTRSYWDKLCRDILGRPLHHEPTAGGPQEEAKYRQQYQNTLDSYARLFGEPAPADIWPPVTQRFQPMRSRWVDVSRHWLLPKPAWVNKVKPHRLQKVALGLLGLSAMVSCQPLLNVFDLKGSEFLQFYLIGFGVACLLSWFLVWIARGNAGRISELPTDPYDIAFIGGGGDRVVDAALASLYGKKLIIVSDAASGTEISTDFSVQVPTDLPEIEAKLLVYAKAITKRHALFKAMHPQLSRMQERLSAQGWVVSAATLRWHRWLAALPLVLLMFVGIIKVFVGLSRDRPVSFLVALLIGSAVFLLFRVSHVSRLTSLGKKAWAKLKGKAATPSRATSPGNMGTADPAAIAMLVALGGYAVLNSGGYAPLHAALYRPVSTSDTSSSGCDSGGCSSSSSCGSSGCGGCGGGD